MTPKMLRTVAMVSLAIGVLLMAIWVLQQAGAFHLIDNPEIGALAAGLVTFISARFAGKSDEEAEASGPPEADD